MMSKTAFSVVVMQVQTLLTAMNSQLQLVSTAENSKLYAVPSTVAIKYDELTVEKLQSMNEKLLKIYQELHDCIQTELIKPVSGMHTAMPYMIPDNPHIPPMRGSFNMKPYTDIGRPHIQTIFSPADQQCLYDEVNRLVKNPIPNHILALFERYFQQERGTLRNGVAYKLTYVQPITGGTQDIIVTNNIITDVDFLRTLLNFPIYQLKFERV